MNYNLKINLSKLRKVRYMTVEGEQFICIPTKPNFVFNGQKGFYLELTAFELTDKRYGESHMIKLNIPQDEYSKLTDEQKNKLPILGSLKEFSFVAKADEQINGDNVKFDKVPKNVENSDDDLPF